MNFPEFHHQNSMMKMNPEIDPDQEMMMKKKNPEKGRDPEMMMKKNPERDPDPETMIKMNPERDPDPEMMMTMIIDQPENDRSQEMTHHPAIVKGPGQEMMMMMMKMIHLIRVSRKDIICHLVTVVHHLYPVQSFRKKEKKRSTGQKMIFLNSLVKMSSLMRKIGHS